MVLTDHRSGIFSRWALREAGKTFGSCRSEVAWNRGPFEIPVGSSVSTCVLYSFDPFSTCHGTNSHSSRALLSSSHGTIGKLAPIRAQNPQSVANFELRQFRLSGGTVGVEDDSGLMTRLIFDNDVDAVGFLIR